ncbi:MAG: hypothetical protein GXY85_09625 [Candidatus Brocadiaceae bacterium]|nr:hypothetical protein [Candidatus Brocadiaceae bacterium]
MAADVKEASYLVWRRLAELAGDEAMVARLHILHQAQQAGCKMTVVLPDGREMRIPEIIAAEAAAAALTVGSEDEWRAEWTRRLVNVAVKWHDEPTTEGIVAVLNHTDSVVEELKEAGVWPWNDDE